MSKRSLKRSLAAAPMDAAAEERAWEVVRAAFVEREPVPRRLPLRVAILGAAAAVAAAAAAFSPPGRAVVDAVRRSIGIEHAVPALFRLPAPGRLLVSGDGGTWVVAADGSKRRLGGYEQASWSPHGLYVVAATANELAAIEPETGNVHWTLARPEISFPRWGGSRTDTRVAYLSTSRLHVVGGDGRGDVDAEELPAAARVAPAWRPGDRHVLAYVTTRGRVVVLDPDAGRVEWVSRGYSGPRSLAWSPDGRRLALAARAKVVLFDARSGRARAVPVTGIRAVAYARDGRLALLRERAVLELHGVDVRTLFTAPGRLAGVAWSPNARWLLTSLPDADQWIFLGGRHVVAVSHIGRQFGGVPVLDGWMSGR